ncbi:MAG: GAF domain-containing protein [Syntrophales bacterium]|nr:GAF domain-containing protein [Syntrophales bacterium]
MTGNYRYFKIISKISQTFEATKDMNTLLHMIVESAVQTMKGKAACLFLADEQSELYRSVAQVGLSENYLHAQEGQSEKIAQLLKQEGHIYYRDAAMDPRLENRNIKKTEGIGSILVVPAIIRGHYIGVLTLYTSKIREFSPDEVEFLKVLAEQGGLAIENARLVESLRRNTRMFSDLAAAIASSLDIKTILQTLTEEVSRSLNVKAASIRLLNDGRDMLQLVASYGLSEKYLDKMVVWSEKSITDALNGKPVMIVDVAADKTVRRRKEKQEEGIISLLSIPIKAKEEVIGILRLYSGTRREFTEDEIMLVTALANLGGLAIQNAGLYLMLQSDLKEMKEASWTYKSWF